MNYKILLIFLFIFSCTTNKEVTKIKFDQSFENSGFALIYSNKLLKDKLVDNKIEDRSLVIFQRNLKKNTSVKITNILNGKTLIATVGKKTKYPNFYNSVISKRIASDLEVDDTEPYLSIVEINQNSVFVANKSKTFDEEKKVAEKAPVVEIGIKDLNPAREVKQNKKSKNFNYVIKIADFYYLETAILLKKRIKDETGIDKVKINELSKTNFRVYLGPYSDLNTLKNIFNKIYVIDFENIEIIKL
tara:strand:- start:215 stop:952 length:738 start_codon:yes stop_codon:yes gene_type:complete